MALYPTWHGVGIKCVLSFYYSLDLCGGLLTFPRSSPQQSVVARWRILAAHKQTLTQYANTVIELTAFDFYSVYWHALFLVHSCPVQSVITDNRQTEVVLRWPAVFFFSSDLGIAISDFSREGPLSEERVQCDTVAVHYLDMIADRYTSLWHHWDTENQACQIFLLIFFFKLSILHSIWSIVCLFFHQSIYYAVCAQ